MGEVFKKILRNVIYRRSLMTSFSGDSSRNESSQPEREQRRLGREPGHLGDEREEEQVADCRSSGKYSSWEVINMVITVTLLVFD